VYQHEVRGSCALAVPNEFQIRVPRAFVNRESLIDEISQHFDFPAHLITLSRLRGYSACTAGASITLTCPTTIRHPSSKRTYVCVIRPTFPYLLHGEREKAVSEIEAFPPLLGYKWRRLLFAVRTSHADALGKLVIADAP